MHEDNKIANALALLEGQETSDPPALVIMSPDSKSFLVGNRGGFIKLAIAALKAAQGQKQVFDKESWFAVQDYDWPLVGLEPDENARIYLNSDAKRKLPKRIGGALGILLFVCPWIVGLGAIAFEVIRLFHR